MEQHLTDLLELASRQHGVFSRGQARPLGIDRFVIARRVARGEWALAGPSVVIVGGSVPTETRAVMAAVLEHGDAVASHHTAAALWGMPGFDPLPAHVLTARPRRGRHGLGSVIHTSRVLPAHHVTVLDGVPVTSPTRTLFDLSRHVHPDRLERLIDGTWSRRLTSGRHLHDMLRDLRGRGRARIREMRRLLVDRGDDYVPPESNLEARAQQILLDAGLGRFRRQVNSGDELEWLGRVDFRDPEYPLILQVDGDRYHRALVDRAADAAQNAALEASGYVVVRITEYQVWHRKTQVIEAVRNGRRRARGSFAHAA